MAEAAKAGYEVLLFRDQPALQLIYDTAPIGLACLSPDCRYLQINQRLTEICGISVEDHLGRFVRDCVPALADSVEQIVRKIVETGEPVVGIEVAGQRADQSDERFWITYWHPLRSPSGEIVAVNVAAEEITERKRAEQEVRKAKDAAEAALTELRETQASLIEAEKLAALGRLVAGIAHEINNPVGISLTVASSLQGKAEAFTSQIVQGDLRRSSLNEFLDIIKSATTQLVTNLNRAAELVQSFKQVAADQALSTRRAFDPGELIEQLASPLREELSGRGVALRVNCETTTSMDSFPGPFGQAVTNLILNSISHAFPVAQAGDAIDIRLRSFGDDQIEIVFSDNGCGMTDDVKRRAFDPFFTTRRYEGSTGLGLHVVHNVVTERLGGRVKLESQAGTGTTIQLILPRQAPAQLA